MDECGGVWLKWFKKKILSEDESGEKKSGGKEKSMMEKEYRLK